MTALTDDRATDKRAGSHYQDPVAAGKTIHAGALVVLDANGNAAPGTAATGLTARGRADAAVDNADGSDGDVEVPVTSGVFRFANNGDITRANIGDSAYIVDDQTVSSSSDTSSRSEAGPIRDVDDNGVWVEIG